MRFKIGDKVKFLNEKGGGIVSKIIGPNLVNVTIEEGFELPVLTNELIRIEEEAPLDSPKHMFREDYKADVPEQPIPDSSGEAHNLRLLQRPGRGRVEEGVFLAFVPEDQKWLITGMLDVYLVNHTRYDLLYSIFRQREDQSFEGFDYGSVEPESMVLLDSMEREKLPQWEKGWVQVLFHTDVDSVVLNPGNAAFKIKTRRFYSENSYHDSAILQGKSILISLLPLSAQMSILSGPVPEKDNSEPEKIQAAKEITPEHLIDKHKTSPHEAVVDLHIEELVSEPERLESSAILRTQVNYFTQCLESAMVNNLNKVTFIHGVGTGVLKTAIKEILKDYPNLETRDASRLQFGYGALEVLMG
jgi:hypothetical protein